MTQPFDRTSRWYQEPCAIPECGQRRATGHQWCHAHVITHAVSAQGGYMSLEEARERVRQGARADDWMPPDDWIAS